MTFFIPIVTKFVILFQDHSQMFMYALWQYPSNYLLIHGYFFWY